MQVYRVGDEDQLFYVRDEFVPEEGIEQFISELPSAHKKERFIATLSDRDIDVCEKFQDYCCNGDFTVVDLRDGVKLCPVAISTSTSDKLTLGAIKGQSKLFRLALRWGF